MLKSRYKIILLTVATLVATVLCVVVFSVERIKLIYAYCCKTSNPEYFARLAVVPHDVSLDNYKLAEIEPFNLPFAHFSLPKIEDLKLSTTQWGAVNINSKRFKLYMLPVFKVPQADLASGMPDLSYEREILRQETLPKSLYKLAIMPLSELKRYNRLASEKITIAKKDLGFFKGTHIKGVIWFGYDNQEQIHVICWSLDGLVSQGILYVPNDKKDLDPLKILLESLENFPGKSGEK